MRLILCQVIYNIDNGSNGRSVEMIEKEGILGREWRAAGKKERSPFAVLKSTLRRTWVSPSRRSRALTSALLFKEVLEGLAGVVVAGWGRG
jgi:hypothetical protein